jgi:hypothetical protein
MFSLSGTVTSATKAALSVQSTGLDDAAVDVGVGVGGGWGVGELGSGCVAGSDSVGAEAVAGVWVPPQAESINAKIIIRDKIFPFISAPLLINVATSIQRRQALYKCLSPCSPSCRS